MGRRRKNQREEPAPAAKKKPAPEATTSLEALFKEAGLGKVAAAQKPAPATSMKSAGEPAVVKSAGEPAVVKSAGEPAVVKSAGEPAVVKPTPAVAPPSHTPRAPAVSPAAELRMLNDAYAGVRPLSKPALHGSPPARRLSVTRAVEEDRAQEAAARARLAALVAGGVRFKVIREDDYVSGYRTDASPRLLARLSGKGFAPDATLDLHGQRAAQVQDLVASFARAHHRKGARQLLMIAGKGLHSADGVGVLRDALVEALTQGAAAPIVTAFATAHASRGGTGAIAVLLT
jgi:DNA-nicking Smr family endonuclease